ncbi:MAG TPA: dihydroorotase, partial [Armatimonadota bacterium]|nr:dihydroorotase [Armatimonadota bacterium]
MVCPCAGTDSYGNVLIRDGAFAGFPAPEVPDHAEVIDCAGKIILPGLVDVHVHLREPGLTHKETIESGTRAAVAGGFTTVLAMPNTKPVIDRSERVADLLEIIERSARCHVLPIGAASIDHKNEKWADFQALRAAGCVAVTDDAFPLQSTDQMAEALALAAAADIPFIAHCELVGLTKGGAVDRSAPVAAGKQQTLAEAAAARLWAAAYEKAASGAARLPRLHLAHISSAAALAPLAALRRGGALVSAETAPQYFGLTSAAVAEHGTNAKMNPPLKSERDREAILGALSTHTIRAIATDHAPHSAQEKQAELDDAPFGVVGLETALAVTFDELVSSQRMSIADVVAAMTCGPASMFRLRAGALDAGAPADLTVFSPKSEWTVEP